MTGRENVGDVRVDRLTLARVNYLSGRIDVHAYLIRSDDAVILVDTGVGRGNPYIERHFEPSHYPLIDLLAERGVVPDDVTHVVNSHLHFDHCGNNGLFPAARVFVQASELDAARQPRYTVREWFDYPGARLVPVHGDEAIATGIALISAPGHTPGHQSVAVQTGEGLVLIAAQAAWTAREYEQGGDPENQAHAGLGPVYGRSLERLKALRAYRVLFSHDLAEANDSARG